MPVKVDLDEIILELDPPTFRGEDYKGANVIIKFKYDMPLWMQNKLIHFYGFVKDESKYNQYVSFRRGPPEANRAPQAKVYNPAKTIGLIKPNDDLSVTQQAGLLRRCDNIAEFFPDPYDIGCRRSVRQRLHNMQQSLKTLAERNFVQDFMDEEFPSVVEAT